MFNKRIAAAVAGAALAASAVIVPQVTAQTSDWYYYDGQAGTLVNHQIRLDGGTMFRSSSSFPTVS